MSDLPTGVVTFLFTDVQGSTRMWEESPHLMMQALEQHDLAVDGAVTENNGSSVKPRGEGDSRFVVFRTATDAVAAAAEMQRRLQATSWVTPTPVVVRVSLHTGTANLQAGDYYGSTVNRAARLRAIAHGGQTLMSRATLELVQDELPAGLSVRDLGEHRLKDLSRPEHVYQVDIEGLPDTFPPLASLDVVPNNLPEQLTDFVGRQGELAETRQLLGETRLLTILAPGGTGKTRLAIQAAADLVGDFPDGVFFIELADIDAAGDIVQTVAESIGLGFASDDDVLTQLLTYLATKRQLLVFDNFEHLQDGAGIIAEILRGAPAVTVLVTSRAKLNLSGETVLTLSGLETTWDTPQQALQTSGVNLFLDAAGRARPGFDFSEADLEPLGQILHMTAGSPLGILLAAAWVDMLPVSEIATEIAKSLDFLETEMSDVPTRQQSMRVVFDYTWAMLSDDERRVFTTLSVFRGGFTREAAHTVAGASLRNLANLANKSLLAPDPASGRYGVHELLRQYAEAELQRDEERRAEAEQAHADFYGGLVDEAFGQFLSGDQLATLARVEPEMDNLRVAWRYSLAYPDALRASKIIRIFWVMYELRGWYSSGVSILDEALDSLDPDADDAETAVARALASAVQATFVALLGQPDRAVVACESAVASLRDLASATDLALALTCWADCLGYTGDLDAMSAVVEDLSAVVSEEGEAFWKAGMLNYPALIAIFSGDPAAGLDLLLTGMRELERANEHFALAWNLTAQGMIALQDGRPQDAIDLYSRALGLASEAGYLRGIVLSQEGLGDAAVAAGKPVDGVTAYVEGMATAEQLGMVVDMVGMMTKIAGVYAEMDRRLEAVELLATVIADPMSAQHTLTLNAPVRDVAFEALAELEAELDPAVYETAHAKGEATPFETAVKELFAGREG